MDIHFYRGLIARKLNRLKADPSPAGPAGVDRNGPENPPVTSISKPLASVTIEVVSVITAMLIYLLIYPNQKPYMCIKLLMC